MDLHPTPTPFPGKAQSTKPKSHRKSSEASKTRVKEPIIHREKRVFGTARNPNVTARSVAEKSKPKPSLGVPGKAVKSSNNVSVTPKKSPDENREKAKKTVNFQDKVEGNKEKTLPEADVSGAQTPSRSPFMVRSRASTPFHSAEKCSKCRFDKLETSSYWIAQIKLSESTGKHFASSAFFKLALECRAEPFRNMKVELKKYLARHEHLSTEEDWKALSVGYGLLKEESRLSNEENKEEGKIEPTITTDSEKEKNVTDHASTEEVSAQEI